LVLALMFLGGNVLFVELAFVTVAAYGLTLLARLPARRHRDIRRLLETTALFGLPWLIAAGATAVLLLPALELVQSVARTPLGYEELRAFRMPASALSNLFKPPDVSKADPYHTALFVGSAGVPFAALGLLRGDRRALIAGVLAGAAVLVALGTPLLGLPYVLLPGFDNLKPLGRVLFLFHFGLAILIAFGADFLLSRFSRSGRARLVGWGLAGLVAVTMIVQMRLYAGDVLRDQATGDAGLYPATALIERLRSEPDVRFLPLFPSFRGSTSAVFRVQNALGYESLLPERAQNLWRVVQGVDPSDLSRFPVKSAYHPMAHSAVLRFDLLARAGVTHLVTPPHVRPDPRSRAPEGTLTPSYNGRDGRIYEVSNALPRAHVVGVCEVVPSKAAALERFQARDFSPRRTVLLEETDVGRRCPEPRSGFQGHATIVDEDLNRLKIEVVASSAAWLTISETWDPGWRAKVDGSEVDVVPANYAFRAIRFPRGTHVVDMTYSPRSYRLGGIGSSVTLVLVAAAFVGIVARRRMEKRTSVGHRTA
jgi:hypothetical protein